MSSEPKVYKNNPSFTPDAPFLSDEAMVEVFNGRPILCVDILFIDRQNKAFILPIRKDEAAKGPWFIGGMIKRNTPPKQMAQKIIEKETNATINSSNLNYLASSWFEWDRRNVEPQENGRVDFNLCYTYEPTIEEISRLEANLDSKEYKSEKGLTSFTLEDLQKLVKNSPAKQVLVDYWTLLFKSN